MLTATAADAPADTRWGFRFGADGVVPMAEAQRRLGGIHERTVRRYADAGSLRIGYRKPGKPSSGTVVCRRSLDLYLAGCER